RVVFATSAYVYRGYDARGIEGLMTQRQFNRKVQTNSTDLGLAIREGCNPMQQMLDNDHDNLPYFGNVMSGDDPRNFHYYNFSLGHIPGRWLNALLNAEDVLQV